VGTVLRALVSASCSEGRFNHRLLCLDRLNPPMAQWAERQQIEARGDLWHDLQELKNNLARADVVHLHWWHHPLLNALMSRTDLPAFRCLLWSHVNGHHAPQNFPLSLAAYPDIMVLSTPWSLQAPALAHENIENQDLRIRIIQSSAGAPRVPIRRKKEHQRFQVGYVGTVAYEKMHPEFLRLCAAADLPETSFIVCGGPDHEQLRQEAASQGLGPVFDIRGPVENAAAVFSSIDVLGYPLNPQHYGTGEQVLLEAMAAGAVPVVLDNGCERHLVENGKTGIVCASVDEYIQALRLLHSDRALLRRLSLNARKSAPQRYPLYALVSAWHRLYNESLGMTPRRRWLQTTAMVPGIQAGGPVSPLLNALEGTAAADLFRGALLSEPKKGAERLKTLSPAWFSATRGSPFHYRQFFPEDAQLASLCAMLREVSVLTRQGVSV
ncbi:MAG TPA: hypothetical protein DEP05_00840, partial [Betaproteobacteria bacterium]|nr:hypothetical protein [Betaproteobacteria bacterium]